MAEKGQNKPRSRQQIESDLTAARTRLTANLESLIDQVHPTNVKQRQVEGIKALASAELDAAKSQFKTADGAWRSDRLALVGGAVAGVVLLLVTVRLIGRKNS